MKELLLYLFDALFQTIKSHSILAEHVENNLVIHNHLKEFNDKVGASRTCITLYHNGGSYITGVSMQKNSCSYEVLKPGISSVIREQQNILISENAAFHSALIKEGLVHFNSPKDCTQTSFRAALENRGVESFYAFSIKNIKNEQIGFLTLDFVNESGELTAEQEEDTRIMCDVLSGYLDHPINLEKSKFRLNQAITVFVLLLAMAQIVDIIIRIKTFLGF